MSRKMTAFAVAALIALSAGAPLQAQQAGPQSGPESAPEAGQNAAPGIGQAANQPPPQGARLERPLEDPAELEEQSRKVYADGKYLPFYIANLRLHKLRPHVPQYMINLVRASALLEKTNTAYHYMHTMQRQGLSFDFNSTEDTLNIAAPRPTIT